MNDTCTHTENGKYTHTPTKLAMNIDRQFNHCRHRRSIADEDNRQIIAGKESGSSNLVGRSRHWAVQWLKGVFVLQVKVVPV